MKLATPLLLLASLGILLAPLGAPDSGDDSELDERLDQLLVELGVDASLPRLDEAQSEADPVPESAPEARQQSRAFMGVVQAPVDFVTDGLVALGLELLSGFMMGMQEGARTVGAAASTIAEAPAQSVAMATAALGLLGLLALLGGAAQRFGGLGAVPLFSRIAKKQLLDHPVRAQVYALIKENPGLNVSEIGRRLNLAWGAVTHHLQKLRAEHLVGIRMVSNQKCYFPNGGTYTQREMDVMSASKHPTARRIADYLIQHGPTNHQDVSTSLDLSPALVSHHLRRLVDAGVVAKARDGRRSIYTPLAPTLNPEPRPSASPF